MAGRRMDEQIRWNESFERFGDFYLWYFRPQTSSLSSRIPNISKDFLSIIRVSSHLWLHLTLVSRLALIETFWFRVREHNSSKYVTGKLVFHRHFVQSSLKEGNKCHPQARSLHVSIYHCRAINDDQPGWGDMADRMTTLLQLLDSV